MVDAVVDAARKNATAKVMVSAFYVASGDKAESAEAAKARATAVSRALQAAGIVAARIETKTLDAGKVVGESPEARRVDVSIK